MMNDSSPTVTLPIADYGDAQLVEGELRDGKKKHDIQIIVKHKVQNKTDSYLCF